MDTDKAAVRQFWERASCGEELYLNSRDRAGYERQASVRYEVEPFILGFAHFEESRGKRVLEIGVGLGADHQRFAEAGAILDGIDLTQRAVSLTKDRLSQFALKSHLQVGDAEALAYPNDHFDVVYSWGVLHHSPDTPRAISEVWRVLKPGGLAKIMIYHKHSMVGYMLWMRYALLKFHPTMILADVYAKYLESPGTKAYSIEEARNLFRPFKRVEISTQLSHGDLLTSSAGQRHRGFALSAARLVWPRTLIRRFFSSSGLFMLITATK